MGVARFHIALHMGAVGDIGVDPDDVGEGHAGFAEDRSDVGEAEIGLLARAFGDRAVGGDAELAGAEHQPLPGRELDAVAVAGEGGANRGGAERLHRLVQTVDTAGSAMARGAAKP